MIEEIRRNMMWMKEIRGKINDVLTVVHKKFATQRKSFGKVSVRIEEEGISIQTGAFGYGTITDSEAKALRDYLIGLFPISEKEDSKKSKKAK